MSQRVIGYVPGTTVLHRMDPLSKFAWVLCATLLSFVLPHPAWAAAQVALIVVLAVVGTPPDTPLLRPLLVLTGLSMLLIVFQTLNVHTGELVARVGPLSVHSGGLRYGVVYALRVATMMLASFVYVRTTDPRRLVVALVRLGIPYRYAWMVFVSLTSISAFRNELVVAREAQLVRGLPPARTVLHRRVALWRRYAQSLLVSGLRRVEVVSVAMDVRGFGAAPTRTFVDPFAWTASGLALAALWFALLVAAAVGRVLS